MYTGVHSYRTMIKNQQDLEICFAIHMQFTHKIQSVLTSFGRFSPQLGKGLPTLKFFWGPLVRL